MELARNHGRLQPIMVRNRRLFPSDLELVRRVVSERGGEGVETCQQLASLDWTQWHRTARQLDGVLERAAKGSVGKRYAAMGRKLRPQALRIAFAAHGLENGMGLFSLHNLLGFPELDDTENVIEIAVGLWLSVYDKGHPLASGQASTLRGGVKLKPADLSPDETLRNV